MKKRLWLVLSLAMAAGLPLWAVTVWFSTAPSSSVNSGVSYLRLPAIMLLVVVLIIRVAISRHFTTIMAEVLLRVLHSFASNHV